MSPLWLLPVVVLVASLPFLVVALRTLRDHTEALRRETQLMRSQLQPALLRVQADGSRLAQHRSVRAR